LCGGKEKTVPLPGGRTLSIQSRAVSPLEAETRAEGERLSGRKGEGTRFREAVSPIGLNLHKIASEKRRKRHGHNFPQIFGEKGRNIFVKARKARVGRGVGGETLSS